MKDVVFQVGGSYENRKGRYTVIAIAGDRMRIRWANGEEAETDVAGQQRVLRNMEKEKRNAEQLRQVQERARRSSDRTVRIAEIVEQCRVTGNTRAAAEGIGGVLDDEEADAVSCEGPDGPVSFSATVLLTNVPEDIKVEPPVFRRLEHKEQIELAWTRIVALPADLWEQLNPDARISLVFRAAKEAGTPCELPETGQEHPIVETALILLRTEGREPAMRFTNAHTCLEGWVLKEAWRSPEPLDLLNLLPRCEGGLGRAVYCEGRLWQRKDRDGETQECVYCPRTKKVCDSARIRPETGRQWEDWSLLELLAATRTVPVLAGLRDPSRYVPQVCGWINRLNEVRERLKCSRCGEMMIPNRGYARFLARFHVTVLSCRQAGDHDMNVYLNQCWACGEIIDSRESRHQEDGYYVCIHCGSGPEESNTYSQGDMCPQCGRRERLEALGQSRKRKCRGCGHVIALPHPDRWTGPLRRHADQDGVWCESLGDF
ncbi:MAG: hypothetical protein JXA58_07350 [Dehalococcoidia bacterium]|nr:hypothetical protein [Dehalococcoidia bacterium]